MDRSSIRAREQERVMDREIELKKKSEKVTVHSRKNRSMVTQQLNN